MSLYSRAGLGLALALTVAAPAVATDCSIHGTGPFAPVCRAPYYAISFQYPSTPADPGQCPDDTPGGEPTSFCLSPGTPPAPASVSCESIGGLVHCSVLPYGTKLSYIWGGNLELVDSDTTEMTDVTYACPEARPRYKSLVIVDVVGPNGETATASTSVVCSYFSLPTH